MEPLKLEITFHQDADARGGMTNLTLNANGEVIVLKLNQKQRKLIESRLTRSFFIRCKKERILQQIDDAPNYRELENIAMKYYLCDVCSFADINLYGVKRVLKVMVEVLYKYPKLRSRLCFVGTPHAMESLLVKMENGDEEVLNRFNLQYICTKENAIKLGRLMHKMLSQMILEHEEYVAMAMHAFGLFDAMLLDKNDYDGYAYLKFISNLRYSESVGFHPKGCHTPESVVYHELGHLLDYMCGLKEDDGFIDFYNGLSKSFIKKNLSEYATTSPGEFIAEAIAEYACNPTPRPIAKKVGALLDRVYSQL